MKLFIPDVLPMFHASNARSFASGRYIHNGNEYLPARKLSWREEVQIGTKWFIDEAGVQI